MQLRLTGIDVDAAPGPSDAGPQEDTNAQTINMGIRDVAGQSRFCFRLDEGRSLDVWSRLCDPHYRM